MSPVASARILVVEDDPRVRRLTVRRLRALGHDTLEAEDGPSALTAFGAGDGVDLLFTDMVMPGGLSGLDVARAACAHVPDLAVVIASGYSEELLAVDGPHGSGFELLAKPYGNDALVAALRAAFERARIGRGA